MYTEADVARAFPDYKVYGKEIAIQPCPNCGANGYKFWCDPKKGVGYCYKCHFSPRLERLLGKSSRPYEDNPLRLLEENKDQDQIEELPPTIDIGGPIPRHVEKFLDLKGMRTEVLTRYRVGYCYEGKYRNRIIFPLYVNGGYKGFQGRYAHWRLPEGTPKWMTGKGTKGSKILWNVDRVKNNWCVVVEGIGDVLSMPRWAVALLGKTASDYQRDLLSYFDHVFIMLDSDRPGQEQARQLASTLFNDAAFRVTNVVLDKGDPGDYDENTLGEIIKENCPSWFRLEDHR